MFANGWKLLAFFLQLVAMYLTFDTCWQHLTTFSKVWQCLPTFGASATISTFFADDSQFIMFFWILQQRWGMLVVLGGHLVKIGDGYWLLERLNIFLSNKICLLINVLHCMNAP